LPAFNILGFLALVANYRDINADDYGVVAARASRAEIRAGAGVTEIVAKKISVLSIKERLPGEGPGGLSDFISGSSRNCAAAIAVAQVFGHGLKNLYLKGTFIS